MWRPRRGGGVGDGFREIVARFDPRVGDLAVSARALIEDVCPEVVEVPWPRQNVVGYGVGPKKMSEHFCYLAFHGDHVNLGFNQGAELPDPEGLLGGPGKTLRHARISASEDLENPALRRLLRAAKDHRISTHPGSHGPRGPARPRRDGG